MKSGTLLSHSGVSDLELADGRHQHEDAPEAIDDRRNRREQLGEEDQRPLQPARAPAPRCKMAMPSAIGVEMISARTDEYSVPQMNGRAPNSPSDGIPGVGLPELPAELPDRQPRFA